MPDIWDKKIAIEIAHEAKKHTKTLRNQEKRKEELSNLIYQYIEKICQSPTK
jgi:hypothetical protein